MITILIANLLDLATFLMAASMLPIEGEGNPLARVLYSNFGIPGILILKLAGLAVIALVLSGIAPSPGRTVAVVILVFLPLFGAFTNVYAVMQGVRT